MCAFTHVEYMRISDCGDILQFPSITQWFLPMGSRLVRLSVYGAQATPHTIPSLLATLPLLQSLEIIDFETPGDAGGMNLPTPSRIPFFECANHLVLRSNRGPKGYPEGSLNLIPPSARFSRLVIHTAYSMYHPDLLNRWLTSSCATLTDLTIWKGEDDTSRLNQSDVHQSIPLTVFFSSPHPHVVGPLSIHCA